MGIRPSVRSIDLEPSRLVRALPDDRLSVYKWIGNIAYGAHKDAFVAFTNETMEIVLGYHFEVSPDNTSIPPYLRTALILERVVELSDASFEEIIEYCIDDTYLDSKGQSVTQIADRAEPIAEEIDRSVRWPWFKKQAYEQYGESDDAVIRYISKAMLVAVGKVVTRHVNQSRNLPSMDSQLRGFVQERTELDLDRQELQPLKCA